MCKCPQCKSTRIEVIDREEAVKTTFDPSIDRPVEDVSPILILRCRDCKNEFGVYEADGSLVNVDGSI